MAYVVIVFMQSFQSHIEGDKPVVVDFFAEWCGPCKYMGPVLKELKNATGDEATILKIDIDKTPATAAKFNVQAVPTLIIFHKGNILWRKSGVCSTAEILEQLRPHL
jgi:thioredoxin 1